MYQRDNLSPCISGFEHIDRYYDEQRQMSVARLLPGQFYVSTQGEMISTTLGSCVSACVYEAELGIGGMNHFMLPVDRRILERKPEREHLHNASRYGDFAMEELVNAILKQGGKRKHLEVKIFGGGKVVSQIQSTDIGRMNIEFIKEYLQFEGLRLLAEDTGDVFPRKVHYYTATGKVKVHKMQRDLSARYQSREDAYYQRLLTTPTDDSDDLELFI